MKKYSIGLITGIIFSLSAFMFIGATSSNNSSDFVSGANYSFSDTGMNTARIIKIYNHQTGAVTTVEFDLSATLIETINPEEQTSERNVVKR